MHTEVTMKSSSRGQLREGNRPWEGSLGESCELTNRNRIGGWVDPGELAQHSKAHRFGKLGKYDSCAAESHAPYRGKPFLRKLEKGLSRGHSSCGNEPGIIKRSV